MRVTLCICVALLVSANGAHAQDHIQTVPSVGSVLVCDPPVEAYPYKLASDDPLYQTALKDHQRYLEELEAYVNCLERERAAALGELGSSFELFMENFGKDAVLSYAADRKAHGQ